jgi:hypothetical protein
MKRMVPLFSVAIIFCCCGKNPRVNPYANNAGIQPAQLAQADVEHYTQIEWIDSVQNFGTLKTKDTIKINFHFKNTGVTPLFITGVKPNCGCTVADYSRNIISPGEGGVLIAKFVPTNNEGVVKKTIRVASNTSNNMYHVLEFYGEIKK